MGLFDGLKLAKDLVKGSISAFKASEKLMELVKRLEEDFDDKLSETDKTYIAAYKKASKDYDKLFEAGDQEAANKLYEEVEAAAAAVLVSASTNDALPRKLRGELSDAVMEFKESEDIPYEIFEKHMMAAAKTDEERAEVRAALDELK